MCRPVRRRRRSFWPSSTLSDTMSCCPVAVISPLDWDRPINEPSGSSNENSALEGTVGAFPSSAANGPADNSMAAVSVGDPGTKAPCVRQCSPKQTGSSLALSIARNSSDSKLIMRRGRRRRRWGLIGASTTRRTSRRFHKAVFHFSGRFDVPILCSRRINVKQIGDYAGGCRGMRKG